MRILLSVLAAMLLPLAASAFSPHAGDRAANIYGRDIVGGGVVHTEDYLGQWLWLEFWSST